MRRKSVLGLVTGTAVAAVLGATLLAPSVGASSGSAAANTEVGRATTATTTSTALPPKVVFAVVNANGTLARGKAVARVAQLSTNTYEVIFTRNVRTCAYTATVGLTTSSGSLPNGQVTVVGRVTSVNGVFLVTSNGTGAAAAQPFHLTVNCP